MGTCASLRIGSSGARATTEFIPLRSSREGARPIHTESARRLLAGSPRVHKRELIHAAKVYGRRNSFAGEPVLPSQAGSHVQYAAATMDRAKPGHSISQPNPRSTNATTV